MPIQNERTVICEICESKYTEVEYGKGFPGWAIIHGIISDKITDLENIQPSDLITYYCPVCKINIASHINELVEERISSSKNDGD
mgnify:CR=1 FL=1